MRNYLSIGGILLLGALYLFFLWRSQPVPEHPVFVKNHSAPFVIAHQGGDGLRPSNTMAAFEHAADLGVDFLEMDIHSSQDGVLVVIHDETVDRTTNGIGRVNEMSFADISTLDAGYHWPTLAEAEDIEGNPYRGMGITIPALEEVLSTFPEYRMVIEIKQKEPSITVPFCDMLQQYGMSDQVVVASFHRETIEEFRQVCPGVPTSGVENEIRRFFILNRLFLGRLYQPIPHAFQVPEQFGNLKVITPRFVHVAQQHNLDVHVWTINDSDDMARLIDLGVDGIITDYPDLLLNNLRNQNE